MVKHTTSANYALIKSNPKAEKTIDFSILPEVKKVLDKILSEDKKDWEDRGLKQFGIERSILLNKVCALVPDTPSAVFEIALEELEVEQQIIPFQQENFTRYIHLGWRK